MIEWIAASIMMAFALAALASQVWWHMKIREYDRARGDLTRKKKKR